jgi:hypothetical protein
MNKLEIYAKHDLSDALTVELDRFNNEGQAVLYVAYSAGAKELVVTLDTLKDMLKLASFKWTVAQGENVALISNNNDLPF